MLAFLVTGNPGSGTSALARELTGRGVPAIDPDEDPELARWADAAGRRVAGRRVRTGMAPVASLGAELVSDGRDPGRA
jgi:dephospho-CoA kinase